MKLQSSKQVDVALPLGALVVLWLVGWTLRIPVLSTPPLSTRIADSFGMGETGIGALMALPVVAVAFGSLLAAWFIGRFGLRLVIVVGMSVMVVASVLRGVVSSSFWLLFVSVLMGLGIAVYQTALPAATRAWTPTHVALGSAVYINGMMVGELSGAGLTLPIIMPLVGGDWRGALLLWALPIVVIIILVGVVRFSAESADRLDDAAVDVIDGATLPRLNDRRVWQFGLLLAGSVVAFFVINTFMGSLLRSRHELGALEGLLFAYNAMPLLASFVILFRPSWVGLRAPIAIAAVLSAVGVAGFVFLSGWLSWGFALVAGFFSTLAFILLISLPPMIARGPAVTRLSAGMTLVGFSFTFVLPLVGGWLADRSGIIEMTLVPSLIFLVVVLLAIGREARYSEYG